MVDRIGFKLTFWIGGANSSYAHRGMDGSDVGHTAMRSIPAAWQREALGLIVRILRPQNSGLLPPSESLPFLVAKDDRGVNGVDVAHIVRTTQKYLINALVEPKTLLRLD